MKKGKMDFRSTNMERTVYRWVMRAVGIRIFTISTFWLHGIRWMAKN